MLHHDVKDYMKGCNVCLASKTVRHKLYGDLESLPVSTYCQKNLLINFVNRLSISTDWKRDSYNSIFVIINRLTIMVHYKPVKIIINTPSLVEVIINVVVRQHSFLDSITNRRLLFISKFLLLLYYFFSIKQKLLIAFHLQIDSQTKRQNSKIKAYF